MNEQFVTLVTRNNKSEQVATVVELGIVVGFLLYFARPDLVARIHAFIAVRWDRFLHWLSVREARWAIRNLPETDG